MFDLSSKVEWLTVAYGCVYLGTGVSAFEAELAGAEGLSASLQYMFGFLGDDCGQAPTWILKFSRFCQLINS